MKLVLPENVREWLNGQDNHGKNVYRCDTCYGEVVTIDTDKGVTPFMIMCRATVGCKGFMQSNFYHCDPSRIATFEFYRPETISKKTDPATKDHLMNGGLLLRPLQGIVSEVPHDA